MLVIFVFIGLQACLLWPAGTEMEEIVNEHRHARFLTKKKCLFEIFPKGVLKNNTLDFFPFAA